MSDWPTELMLLNELSWICIGYLRFMSWDMRDLSLPFLFQFWEEKYAWYFWLEEERGVPISVRVGVIILRLVLWEELSLALGFLRLIIELLLAFAKDLAYRVPSSVSMISSSSCSGLGSQAVSTAFIGLACTGGFEVAAFTILGWLSGLPWSLGKI